MKDHICLVPSGAPEVPLPPFSEEAREAVLKGTKTVEDIERETREFQDWKMERRKVYGNRKEIPCHTFLNDTAAELLAVDGMCNSVYSPFSLYHALLIMASLCSGETRGEIFRLLGDTDPQELESTFASLLSENCFRGGYTALPSASLQLDSSVEADVRKLSEIAARFACPVYSGNMDDGGCHKAAIPWMDQASGMKSDDAVFIPNEAKMLMVTELFFRAGWKSEFEKSDTKKGVFHTCRGDTPCRYMHMSSLQNVWIGNGFSALQLPFAKMGCMWFILPEPGKTPQDILKSGIFAGDASPFGTGGSVSEWDVTMSVPRFGISNILRLKESLQRLGIGKVFSAESETPYTHVGKKMIALDELQQDTEIRVNEKGCEGSCRTIGTFILTGELPPPPPKMDFILDRPFLFAVYGRGNLPLFLGAVNHPDED